MKTKNTKIRNINVHFWILFNIAICAIMNDYAVYITGINYGISLIISAIILIVTNFWVIKKKIVTIKSDFEWYDLVFILLIVIIAALRIAIPDYSYDTANYHIYLQENIKIDKINFDFFAGKTINGFLFPLGDRINYIARYLLGYRLGTIFSYYSIIVIFYQTKNLLNYITGKRKINSLLAILCWSSYVLRKITGCYSIDIYSIVFTLEIIYFLLKEKDCFESKYKIYAMELLTGILTGIKLPNLILITPIFLLFLVKRRKQLKIKNIPIYLVAVLVFIIPFILYIIDNIIQTGSPVYPYYNNVFKSEYFGNYSWVEPRFGIPNLKYKLLWPGYTSLSRDGYGDEIAISDPIWAVGYIVTLLYIIYGTFRWKEKDNKLYIISIISIIITFVWIQFLYGYMRYGLIIPVLYVVVIGVLINKFIYSIVKKRFSILPKFIINICIAVYISLIALIYILYPSKGINFSCISSNYKLVFKDRETVSIHIDGVWGVIADDSALVQMLREDNVPIYNLQSDLYELSPKAKSKYNEILEQNKDNIYILIDANTINRKERELKKESFDMQLVKIYTSDEIPYIQDNNVVYLYKLNK